MTNPKHSILAMLLLLGFPTISSADLSDEWYRLKDTVVQVENIPLRIRHVAQQEFDSLHALYRRPPSTPIKNIKEIQKILGRDYTISYNMYATENDTVYSFDELRRDKKFRLIISENEGLQGYYPQERIMLYFGGHQSDQAFFVDTGEEAYSPEEYAISQDGLYRITGLHNGQDNIDYNLERKDTQTGQYERLCNPVDVEKQVPYPFFGSLYLGYLHEMFWVDHTLYFRLGRYEEEDSYLTWFRYYALTPYGELPPPAAWEKGIYIPDPVFRAYCLQHFDTDGDGAISEQEAQSVTEININGRNSKYPVHNVVGISYFSNLVRLDCSYNQLRSIELNGLDQLQYLDCSHNRLVNLWTSYTTDLREINCSNNRLRSFSASCPQLRKLNCNHNRIKMLNLYSYKQLEQVDCTDNPEMTILHQREGQVIEIRKPDKATLHTIK